MPTANASFKDAEMQHLTFEVLCQQCIEGHPGAQRQLEARFRGLVWRTIRSHLPYASEQDREEAVNDTFLKLLEDNAAALAKYRPIPNLPPEAYIRRFAVFQAMNHRRKLNAAKRARQVSLEETLEAAGDGPLRSPEDGPEQRMLRDEALEALLARMQSQLTPAEILTFELLYVRELEPAEAAKLLSCSTDVIYTRKRRLLVALAEVVEDKGA